MDDIKDFTLIIGDRYHNATVDYSGTLGEAGAPYPVQPVAAQFIPPLGNLDKAWYEATRRFGPYNHHPEKCEDWNLETGGDTDKGEPLVAPFDGLVINAEKYGVGWGNILRILGRTVDGEVIVWMGAHLEDMLVSVGDIVACGQPIGTIGNANGKYAAHLHEQISVGKVPPPDAFGSDPRFNFVQPSAFYVEHGVDADLMRRLTEFDGE